jgi:hypothetical protein
MKKLGMTPKVRIVFFMELPQLQLPGGERQLRAGQDPFTFGEDSKWMRRRNRKRSNCNKEGFVIPAIVGWSVLGPGLGHFSARHNQCSRRCLSSH